jgi:hypothetical protein
VHDEIWPLGGNTLIQRRAVADVELMVAERRVRREQPAARMLLSTPCTVQPL